MQEDIEKNAVADGKTPGDNRPEATPDLDAGAHADHAGKT
jgi:hypothetical protein